MLKKTIIFAALAGFAFTVNTPTPAYAGAGYCQKRSVTGSGRSPTKSTAKAAARLKWRINVLKLGRPHKLLWSASKNRKTTCLKKYYGYKCWARAIPCAPLGAPITKPKRTTTQKGVNIDPWCKEKFGKAFKAKLVGQNASGWTCERSIVDRRPVSFKDACKLQYGKKRVVRAKALNGNDPYSWKCVVRK